MIPGSRKDYLLNGLNSGYTITHTKQRGAIKAAGTGSQYQWSNAKIAPLTPIVIEINQESLESILPAISEEQKQYRILEINLNYRREVDLKEYSESAFFFYSPDGIWVNETSSALDSALYEQMKNAISSKSRIIPEMYELSDPLHKQSE